MWLVGGALWLGSTIYKNCDTISGFIRKSEIGSKIIDSKPVKKVKEAGKKPWDWTKKTFLGG